MNVMNFKYDLKSNRANVFHAIEKYNENDYDYYVYFKTDVDAEIDEDTQMIIMTDDVLDAISLVINYIDDLTNYGLVCFKFGDGNKAIENVVAITASSCLTVGENYLNPYVHNNKLVFAISIYNEIR